MISMNMNGLPSPLSYVTLGLLRPYQGYNKQLPEMRSSEHMIHNKQTNIYGLKPYGAFDLHLTSGNYEQTTGNYRIERVLRVVVTTRNW